MRARAIVTGAGNGIGSVIARDLAEDYALALVDVDANGLERVAADLAGDTRTFALDVTDERAVEAMLDELGEPPRLLAHAAAIIRLGTRLLDVELPDWQSVLTVNVTGTFVVARSVARRMAAGDGGTIVTIASVNAIAPTTGSGSYSASKAAVISLTEQMALEWASHGIRVNAVAPGIIDAGMGSTLNVAPEQRRRRDAMVPLGKQGSPHDIAAAVKFLASDQAAYISGHTLVVDGALTKSTMLGVAGRGPEEEL